MASTQQRAELHKTIWAIANDLRGAVDGWDFKQYVLGTLFYRYISEDMAAYIDHRQQAFGLQDFHYENFYDAQAAEAKDDIVKEKGIFILPSQLFCNVCANAANDENLNETLAHIFTSIEASSVGTPSESDYKGLFEDVDVNATKLGNTVAERNKRLPSIGTTSRST